MLMDAMPSKLQCGEGGDSSESELADVLESSKREYDDSLIQQTRQQEEKEKEEAAVEAEKQKQISLDGSPPSSLSSSSPFSLSDLMSTRRRIAEEEFVSSGLARDMCAGSGGSIDFSFYMDPDNGMAVWSDPVTHMPLEAPEDAMMAHIGRAGVTALAECGYCGSCSGGGGSGGSGGGSFCFDEGDEPPLTVVNMPTFARLMHDRLLGSGVRHQMEAFADGVGEVLSVDRLYGFSGVELKAMFCGLERVVWTSDSLRDDLQVSGQMKRSSASFGFLVSEMAGMSQTERQQFLTFVTASPVVVAGQNVARQITVTGSSSPLVTASSCDNLLKLPEFRSQESLHEAMQVVFANLHQGGFSDRGL